MIDLTAKQAAGRLGVHINTVYRYCASGLIGYQKTVGGEWRIPPDDLDDLRSGYTGDVLSFREEVLASRAGDLSTHQRQTMGRLARRAMETLGFVYEDDKWRSTINDEHSQERSLWGQVLWVAVTDAVTPAWSQTSIEEFEDAWEFLTTDRVEPVLEALGLERDFWNTVLRNLCAAGCKVYRGGRLNGGVE